MEDISAGQTWKKDIDDRLVQSCLQRRQRACAALIQTRHNESAQSVSSFSAARSGRMI